MSTTTQQVPPSTCWGTDDDPQYRAPGQRIFFDGENKFPAHAAKKHVKTTANTDAATSRRMMLGAFRGAAGAVLMSLLMIPRTDGAVGVPSSSLALIIHVYPSCITSSRSPPSMPGRPTCWHSTRAGASSLFLVLSRPPCSSDCSCSQQREPQRPTHRFCSFPPPTAAVRLWRFKRRSR